MSDALEAARLRCLDDVRKLTAELRQAKAHADDIDKRLRAEVCRCADLGTSNYRLAQITGWSQPTIKTIRDKNLTKNN
ncbi:hypothetical protein HMPREF9306_00229 [Propionimicrobium lymphophilum ACS-093-V-SCH5]|uniref:Uncharacterized protein n=1 Tax=Propionimicrobium lymphophilum ACS-093-V-SCH5 TaxID=883161 RepID=S2W6E4_9ACTN|nr:hypothetical protein [Propionimicrobium lymphophilum]EPD33815.1 hypothetical protein HMPREF9306_00229 [Propionimicrobium lymphophilum ACS-093-V-SCH5]